MTPEQQLTELARKHRLGCYFNARERASGRCWIALNKSGFCLAEFRTVADALAWFPKSPDGRQRQEDSHSVAHSF